VKAFQQVLFLCTANFYRSRHAEFVFNYLSLREGLEWRARSAGFRPYLAPEPLSHCVEKRLEELLIPLPTGTVSPRGVEVEDLSESSLVVAMDRVEHEPMIREEFPLWIDRVRYWEIKDWDCVPPEIALPMVESEVEQLMRSLLDGHALGCDRDILAEF